MKRMNRWSFRECSDFVRYHCFFVYGSGIVSSIIIKRVKKMVDLNPEIL